MVLDRRERHQFLLRSEKALKAYLDELAEKAAEEHGLSLSDLQELIERIYLAVKKQTKTGDDLYDPNIVDWIWDMVLSHFGYSQIEMKYQEFPDLTTSLDSRYRRGPSGTVSTFTCPRCNGLVVVANRVKYGYCTSCSAEFAIEE